MARDIGIPVAVQTSMMGRSHGTVRTRVMGPILFPVTLEHVEPDGVTMGVGLSSRVNRSEQFLSQPSPRFPRHDGIRTFGLVGAMSLLLHWMVLTTVLVLAPASRARSRDAASQAAPPRVETPMLVFLMKPVRPGPGGGGGGGGNRQRGPIPRAQAPGRDSITLPVAIPITPTAQPRDEVPPPQAVALDAKPLASGSSFQVGLLDGPPALGTSQGPGSGGGVGEGVGTGIGSGRGPGLGPGSGGGTGGGVYRPGSGVTAPTLLLEVKPTYTADALRAKIQGSVLLEVIIQRDGIPRDIRVIRSLDPHGLDQQAVLAVKQWRFGAGRLNGVPVDVQVAIQLDFRIH